MNDKAFTIAGLTQQYEDFQLGPLELELEPGTVLALVGPNGAGKTTMLECLAGRMVPDAGRIEIFGRPNRLDRPEWKHEIGHVGEETGYFGGWTAARNLEFRGRFYPGWSKEWVEKLARRFDLPLDKRVSALSKGGRAKLALVAALGHDPRLLLLDEPTSGLDPVVRSEVLDVLWEVLEDGERAILYSTHVLSDIARLADELAFLRDGRLGLRASAEELTDAWRRITFRLEHDGLPFEGAVEHRRSGVDHQLLSRDGTATLAQLRELGAENVVATRMPIEEIAVEILKGADRVAIDPS